MDIAEAQKREPRTKNLEESTTKRNKQEREELNMTAELQRVSNGPDQVLIEEAYMAGYLEAVEYEKRRKQAAKEKRERKKYFLTQKLYGVATLIFTAAVVKILNGDATIALLTVPLGVTLLTSKEMLIINEYYWKCEDERCNL